MGSARSGQVSRHAPEHRDGRSFLITTTDKEPGNQANQPWTAGTAPDGHGKLNIRMAGPMGPIPDLGFGRSDTHGQKEQSNSTVAGMKEKIKDVASHLAHD